MTKRRLVPEVVIYHGPQCYDGFTAAWLLHRHFPDADYLPVQYGDELPMPVDKRVLMVDFSYPREKLIELHWQSAALLVLDHHRTAREALDGLDFCEFDMERAGCQMAWDWLVEQDCLVELLLLPDGVDGGFNMKKDRRHWLIEHVADRDLWRNALPSTPLVHAYYTSVPMTFHDWSEMAASSLTHVVSRGEAIRASIDRYCEKVGQDAILRQTSWGEVWTVNAPYINASELADYLIREREAEWSVAWFQRPDGRFQYSLRSRGEFDVAEVAKSYGGGGHLNAAGFHSDLPPWEIWSPTCESGSACGRT